ncbi:class I SAM-dependent methyltransferase [Commensalibacter melissae]|uniref:class I SAM-dependent methyltransferase n=1 Tax=Commensalibacter melissae TaxID=2070537 RepID=UPI0012D9508F|nr:SAM-dependent methyltransferase [Commensalibacter melissae]MUG08455.1 class I SAM-dependent methyltransferase [Commensalibacter melissae]
MKNCSEMRLDQFMEKANVAYYEKRDPFSDFITAPEISQIFGELIAVWIITVIRSMSKPDKLAIVEAGPGRGTLMMDILRVLFRSAPDICQYCTVFLIETSSRLRQIQENTLKNYEIEIQWLDSVYDIPTLPLIMVANEFLDALPIRQFIYRGGKKWDENYVSQGNMFHKPISQLPFSPVFQRPIKVGDTVEVNEAGQDIVQYVSAHICHYGGAALFIDYGYSSQVWGDSLQAIANREKVSPFVPPGEADLTAHIDFPSLKEIAEKQNVTVYGIQTQGAFLKQLGILIREKILLDHVPIEQRNEIRSSVQRLIDPTEMGDLFKVMAICNAELCAPPGF